MSYKSTALKTANVKSMATGNLLAAMQVNDYVIGDVSTMGTDMVNFTEFYRASGTVFNLPETCKVSLTNLTTPVLVGGVIPPPPPPPATASTMLVTMTDTDTGEIWVGAMTRK